MAAMSNDIRPKGSKFTARKYINIKLIPLKSCFTISFFNASLNSDLKAGLLI